MSLQESIHIPFRMLLIVAASLGVATTLEAIDRSPSDRLDLLNHALAHARERNDPERIVLHLGDRTAPLTRMESGRLVDRPVPGTVTRTETDWTPYAGPFALADAAHLLRRATIGPQFHEMEEAVTRGLANEVDLLLLDRLPPLPPGDWASEPLPDLTGWTDEMIDSLLTLYRERSVKLQLWWAEGIATESDLTATESMTLFWHDHFATAVSGVTLPQSMYVQNELLRSQAFGNVRDLVAAIAIDPAMLIWLNGNQNRVGDVNENFARELLELFTLGLDQYTQDDVVAAARAFTGYVTFDGVTSSFIPEWHDYGEKTFLGQTGNFDGPDIIGIIFEQDEAARFFCRKLYRWFVDEYPDELLIDDLAVTLRSSDYEIRPVLSRIFNSEHFFDPEFRGSLITDGIDKSAGVIRTLYIEGIDLSDPDFPQAVWTYYSMGVLGQMLFEPPNVAGWPGYRNWVNSYTLPWRKTLDTGLIDGNVFGYDIEMQADVMALVERLTNPFDAEQLVDDIALYLFGLEPTELVRERMLEELLQGSQPWEWDLYAPESVSRIQGLIRFAMRLPDDQLK